MPPPALFSEPARSAAFLLCITLPCDRNFFLIVIHIGIDRSRVREKDVSDFRHEVLEPEVDCRGKQDLERVNERQLIILLPFHIAKAAYA